MQYNLPFYLVYTAIMHYVQVMKTYLTQLNALKSGTELSLLYFFKEAGVPTSTYYRALAGKDLRYSTAIKVEHAILSYTLSTTQSQHE